MNEIQGAGGPSNVNELTSQPAARAGKHKSAGSDLKLTRGSDDVGFSAEGRALSHLSDLQEVRTEVVNRVSAEVNDPEFDIDGKFEIALDKMLEEVFGA